MSKRCSHCSNQYSPKMCVCHFSSAQLKIPQTAKICKRPSLTTFPHTTSFHCQDSSPSDGCSVARTGLCSFFSAIFRSSTLCLRSLTCNLPVKASSLEGKSFVEPSPQYFTVTSRQTSKRWARSTMLRDTHRETSQFEREKLRCTDIDGSAPNFHNHQAK